MFERYRAYHAYRRAVFEWATRHDYQRSDIQFVYPWDTRETPTASIIVLLQPEKLLDDEQYHHIYQSQNVHIYERKTDDLQPAVRHGIPSQLQTALLAQARSVIELEVQGSTDVEIGAYEAYRTLAEEDCYVDVTVWVDGMTRGSYVMHDTLMGAVVAAAKRAGKDSRYKPLTPKELATMRVEVVVVVDLWLPLTILDAALPVNIATRLMQRGETKAWFVPTVPNVVRYEHLGEYLNRLLTKAGSALVPDIAHGFTYAPCFSFVE